ncbi:heterokaryon incompatibility protein-domain-containing protein [Leptodontidium sp. MPI-SDFR-AT-0119]|nr:heterokaryon incompatibility protein-domain-containing protein [Leptodontidium sp. MPI-SDFR-AT-0119]
MSALCTASSELLVLDYSDLCFLSKNDDKKPLARDIEIRFIYNAGFIIGPEGISGRLAIPEWELGTTLLCGSCPFCLLIQQGVRRSLDSCPWPWLGLAAIFEDETHIPVTVDVRLNKFAYVKDTSPWAAGQENLKTWNVHSVSLGGMFSLKFGPGLEQVAKLIETELVLPLVELQFEMFADQNNSLAKLLNIHRKSLDSSPLSDTNVSNIRRWMDECDRDHEWCSIHSSMELAGSSNFLPTRLLDVGNPETGVQVRLVLTDTFSETERRQKDSSKYMALSYCWGSVEESRRLLKTTHSTIQERLRAIKFSTMPLAVQDAVTVARTLKIQYIWIDSLCIIQDDTEDWQIESSRMGDIFSNAYLTVVAAVGSSCHDSFLYREPNQLSCDVNVQSQVFGIDDGQFSLRSRRRRGTEKMSEIFDSKWISRGWTFQEERLARRVLMFGKNKFFLDCRTIERAEDTVGNKGGESADSYA